MNRFLWSPWHGCHKCSPGCQNCYVYYLDHLHQKDASIITKSKTNFTLPLKKTRNGDYKIPSKSELATCFTSDFFLKEADEWREEAWSIMKQRSDVTFLICTKRVERFYDCIPSDWGSGYSNVILAVTCENLEKIETRLPILLSLPVQKKYVFVSPILEEVHLSSFLKTGKIDFVSVGGESYLNARECNFDWIKIIKKECDEFQVEFDFHQTGSHFIKNGNHYKIPHHEEYRQAKKAMKYLEEND